MLSVDCLSAALPRVEIACQAQTGFKAADQLGLLTGPERPEGLLKPHIHLVSIIIGADHKVDQFETLLPLARRCGHDSLGETRISRAIWTSTQKERTPAQCRQRIVIALEIITAPEITLLRTGGFSMPAIVP